MIDYVRSRFADDHVTIVTDEHDTGSPALLPRSTIVRVRPSDIDGLYRPSAEMIRSIAARKYDLAIDLNLDFLLPSAYICRASNARVRVGFARERADLFFNFQMQPDGAQQGALYARLAACLKMF
jgi:ADP-heptose:LPS heptosyltransferase